MVSRFRKANGEERWYSGWPCRSAAVLEALPQVRQPIDCIDLETQTRNRILPHAEALMDAFNSGMTIALSRKLDAVLMIRVWCGLRRSNRIGRWVNETGNARDASNICCAKRPRSNTMEADERSTVASSPLFCITDVPFRWSMQHSMRTVVLRRLVDVMSWELCPSKSGKVRDDEMVLPL